MPRWGREMKSIPANQDSLEDPPGHLAEQIEGDGWFSLLVSLLSTCRSAVLSLSSHHRLRTPYCYCGHSCWHSPYQTQPTVPLQHLLAPDVRQGNGLVTICDPSFTLICRGRTCHSLLSLVLEDIKSIACMIKLYSLFPCISIALRRWP